jgi:predicted lipoprotein with Yx(FWY)xxD motif
MTTKAILAVAGAGTAIMLMTGCGTHSGAPTEAPQPTGEASAADYELAVRETPIGTVLTDGDGFTLYLVDEDTPTTIGCTGPCADIWPPALGTPSAGAPLPGSVGTTTRPDGAEQATYDGHPLYRFAKDTAPGQTSGDGVKGTWHVVKVDTAHG